MKHLFLLFFMMVCTTMNAQKDVTTFLGIPVDGTQTEIKQKIIQKGFTPITKGGESFLKGEFNGIESRIYIGTNNNKVFRIMVCDDGNYSEGEIKVRFNNLIEQFKNNGRYLPSENSTLSDNDDIGYEMDVNNKIYTAHFFQVPDKEKIDTLDMQNKVYEQLLLKYTEEQLKQPTQEMVKEADDVAYKMAMDMLSKKIVWIRICESSYNKYYICIYYDNGYNMANGEDL